jgi:hypothetical protein
MPTSVNKPLFERSRAGMKGLAAESPRVHPGTAMTTFESMHRERIVGKLTAVDRLIFKGYMTGLMPDGAFARFLASEGILLKHFASYVDRATRTIKQAAQRMAQEHKRPFEYLASAHTAARGCSKEDRARAIADKDQITEGLVAVFSTLEPCKSFEVRGNRSTHKLEAVYVPRKCLFLYFYFVDRDFGLMHVRVQTWFPFSIQVYVNGREYLCKQLSRRQVAYQRYDNAITQVEDLALAQQLSDRLVQRDWARVLDAFARRVNPWLPIVQKAGFGGYYWVIDQCEIATDVMFKDRAAIGALLPDLFEAGMLSFSADDVLRFLGRKPHPALTAEVTSDHKRRPEGRRVKHRVRNNSIKMYDKWNVLRIETTINHPRDFKILKSFETDRGVVRRWVPMSKNVSNLRRYFEVASAANERYLDAMANVAPKGESVHTLDDLCQSHVVHGRRVAKLAPLGQHDTDLFKAVLHGEHLIHGFRNRDVRQALPSGKLCKPGLDEERRRAARVSRLLAKLRGHGLVAKVPQCHLYRVTSKGHRLMAAALRVRYKDFPDALREAA